MGLLDLEPTVLDKVRIRVAGHGGFSSNRQGLLQQSVIPFRSDYKNRPKTSVPLRTGSVQTTMGTGRGVVRDALPSGEKDSIDTVAGNAGYLYSIGTAQRRNRML